MPFRTWVGLAGVLLAAGLACASVWVFVVERAVYSLYRSDRDEAFAVLRLRDTPLPIGVSARARSRALNMCSEALVSPLSNAFPADEKRKVAAQCETVAQNAIAVSPTFGPAWMTLARSLYELGEVDAAADALIEVSRLAPFEGWLIQNRVLLARDILATETVGGGQVEVLLREDMAKLFGEGRTLDWLAALYVAAPDLHSEIADAAEKQDDATQAAFLRRVRRQSGLGG